MSERAQPNTLWKDSSGSDIPQAGLSTTANVVDSNKVATESSVAAKADDDAVVHLAGDNMTGTLGVTEIDGDPGIGALYIADSPDWNADIVLNADGTIGLEDNIDGTSAYLGPDGFSVIGNVIASSGLLAAPKVRNVPLTGGKTLSLTTADNGIVLVGASPSTGGIINLPQLTSGDYADFLLVNLTGNAVTIKAQVGNSIVHIDASAGDYTFASHTAVRLAYYGAAGNYYQVAPEA